MYEACATETRSRINRGEGIATVRLDHRRHLDGSHFDAQVCISCPQRIPWAAAFHCNTASCISPSFVIVYGLWGPFYMFQRCKNHVAMHHNCVKDIFITSHCTVFSRSWTWEQTFSYSRVWSVWHFSRSNSIKSPPSGAGNIGQPRLMSHVRRVHEAWAHSSVCFCSQNSSDTSICLLK
jgi:hypothetical protein